MTLNPDIEKAKPVKAWAVVKGNKIHPHLIFMTKRLAKCSMLLFDQRVVKVEIKPI